MEEAQVVHEFLDQVQEEMGEEEAEEEMSAAELMEKLERLQVCLLFRAVDAPMGDLLRATLLRGALISIFL